MRTRGTALVLLLLAGCGTHGSATLSQASATPTHTNRPIQPAAPGVHFTTPEAAMRYLAVAWNNHDLVSLKHVTDPTARQLLIDMYAEATHLRLNHCSRNPRGDYECFFDHDYPKGDKAPNAHGTAQFTVGPADKPGWYMTFFESCN